MPKILFASNSISHFIGTSIANEVGSWTPYDTKRVPYAIKSAPGLVATSPKFKPSTTTETWLRFTFGATRWDYNNNERIATLLDADGKEILNLQHYPRNGYYMYFNADGQSTTEIRGGIPFTYNQARVYDMRVVHDTANSKARAEIYMNELLLSSSEFTTANPPVPTSIWIGGHSTAGYYSEIIVADGDTRNGRLDLVIPQAEGAYREWDGLLGALSDDDPTTGMTAVLADQKQTTIMTEYTGASNISNIVQVTTTVKGENAPEGLDHLVRVNGADHYSTEYPLVEAKEIQVTDWAINPATSQPWTSADLTNIEFGFRSKA